MGGSWIKAFRLENARINITLFFKYILQASGQLGYAGILDMAGILALVLLAIVFLCKRKELLHKDGLILLICSATSLLALFIIVISYQGGINDHPLNGRFYIPILVTLSIAPVYLLAHVFKNRQQWASCVLISSLAVFIFYHPVAVEDRLTNNLMIIREYRYLDNFLKKNADKNTLIICGRPGQLIVSNYGSVSYNTANMESNIILGQMRNHLFSKIYVVQSIAYSNKEPFKDNALNSNYHLETEDELQMTGNYFFRISQVKI